MQRIRDAEDGGREVCMVTSCGLILLKWNWLGSNGCTRLCMSAGGRR